MPRKTSSSASRRRRWPDVAPTPGGGCAPRRSRRWCARARRPSCAPTAAWRRCAGRDRRRGGFAQRVVGDAAAAGRRALSRRARRAPCHGPTPRRRRRRAPEAADGRVDARRLQRRHRQLAGRVAAPLEQVERGGGGDRAVGAARQNHRVAERQTLGAAPLASQQALQRRRHAGGLQLGEQRRAVDPGVDQACVPSAST